LVFKTFFQEYAHKLAKTSALFLSRFLKLLSQLRRQIERELGALGHGISPLTRTVGHSIFYPHQTRKGRPPVKAIETKYQGFRFRSRTEARWAVFFDTLGIEWDYEKEGYELPSGWYLPDFWLPQFKCFFEVKGTWPTEQEIRKAIELSDGLETPVLFGYTGHKLKEGNDASWLLPPMLLVCGNINARWNVSYKNIILSDEYRNLKKTNLRSYARDKWPPAAQQNLTCFIFPPNDADLHARTSIVRFCKDRGTGALTLGHLDVAVNPNSTLAFLLNEEPYVVFDGVPTVKAHQAACAARFEHHGA